MRQRSSSSAGQSSQQPGAGPILFVLNSLTVGGSEVKTVRLANALNRSGMSVGVAYLNPPDTLARGLDRSVPLIHLGRRGKFSATALRRLVSAIRSIDAKVVVGINLYASLYVALAGRLCGRPRPRLIGSVNTTDFGSRKEQMQMLLYRYVLRSLDCMLFGAVSQYRSWSARYSLGRSGGSASVLYNGVDTDHFSTAAGPFPALAEAPRTKYLVGTVGTLRPEKAHVHLLQAVTMLRLSGLDVGAAIVGDGPECERLRREIASRSLADFVVVVGERTDVRPILASLDVFVLTSTAVETFSNAALEAMAMGVPVVSSRIGGMPEMLRYGGGLLYEPGDVRALALNIEALLKDPARRHELSTQARAAAVEYFSWTRMIEGFLEIASGPGRDIPANSGASN